MLSSSRLFLFATLVALALGGCDCSSDPSNRDGGGGGNDDGGGDGGDTDPTDGGDDDGGGGGGDGGPGSNTCLTIEQACPGKCGNVSNNCGMVYDCSSAGGTGAGGVICDSSEVCRNQMCTPPTLADGGVPPTCTPTRTCGSLGHTCGRWDDGCGNVLDCWPSGTSACASNMQACLDTDGAGSGTSFSCISTSSGGSCTTTLCPGQAPAGTFPTCSAGSPTRLTGRVLTPGRAGVAGTQIPVPNAIVYIPSERTTTLALPAIKEGVDGTAASCGRCTQQEAEAVTAPAVVLASATTNYRGDFVLEGQIPIGQNFDLVIRSGKWRRVVQINALGVGAGCNSTALTTEQSRLNADPSDGRAGTWLPHIAVALGEVDAMECVLRNIGISESMFRAPDVATTSTAARIHLYQGYDGDDGNDGTLFDDNSGPLYPSTGSSCMAGTNACEGRSLYGNTAAGSANRLNEYDMVIFDCEGGEVQRDAIEPRIVTYVNQGGRMFASHWSYSWIKGNGTLNQSADWNTSGAEGSGIGRISLPMGALASNSTFRSRANATKSLVFWNFLDDLGALDTTGNGAVNDPTGLQRRDPPTFSITDPRDLAGANAGPSTDEWVYRTTDNGSTRIQQLSFNTPYGSAADAQCGRVAYSGFHVASVSGLNSGNVFPTYCSNGALTPQELVLVYMLFDLNSCVSTGIPTPPPTCSPIPRATVCTANKCGSFSDGCGGIHTCDPCPNGTFCGSNNTCVSNGCTPDTCASLGNYECGQWPDNCGGIADSSGNNDTCGMCPTGEFCRDGQCVNECTPVANPCGFVGAQCGDIQDNCGNPVNCGGCGALVCVNNQCPLE